MDTAEDPEPWPAAAPVVGEGAEDAANGEGGVGDDQDEDNNNSDDHEVQFCEGSFAKRKKKMTIFPWMSSQKAGGHQALQILRGCEG